MNLKLNMKDIKMILAKTHFKCNLFLQMRRNNTFLQKCLYELKLLEVSLSCLHFSPHVLWGRSQVSLFSASVVSPGLVENFIDFSSLKQKSINRHVSQLIILMPSQPVFVLSPQWWVLSREATNTNFIVFGLTWLGLEPTIHHIRGEHASH